MRYRGWTKFDNTRIERVERFRRRRRCWLKVGAFTLEPYCGTHGRAEGWPCRHAPDSQLTAWPGVRADEVLPRVARATPPGPGPVPPAGERCPVCDAPVEVFPEHAVLGDTGEPAGTVVTRCTVCPYLLVASSDFD